MKNPLFAVCSKVAVAIAGSALLASCSKQPPSQTIINVQVPSQNEKADADKTGTASARNSEAQSDGASIELTERYAKPAPARKSAMASSKSLTPIKAGSALIDFYDRLPIKHFAAFGGANRRSLLKRKGAIVDYQHNFIEIPGSAAPADGDLRMLQITLFPNGDEPWCAVSRIVWPQGKTPGALDFYYGVSDSFDRHPRTASEDFFPYKLGRFDGGYVSAYLPQRGLTISTSSNVDSEPNGYSYRYNRKFGVGGPAFVRVTQQENG